MSIKPFSLLTRKPLPFLNPAFLSSVNGLSTEVLNLTVYKLASLSASSDAKLTVEKVIAIT